MSSIKKTPMMEQYIGFKKQYPDKIVLFRMGDFFETFGDDAKLTAKILNITLTTRDKKSNPTPLAGFPHKAIDQYLPKLIKAGECVVVVDQLEDPKFAKGIVKRGVTRVVTPGTLDGDQAEQRKNSYLASIYSQKGVIGISFCDVSTGEFISTKVPEKNLQSVLNSYEPVEVLLLEGDKGYEVGNIPVHFVSKSLRNERYSSEKIREFFEIADVVSLGIEDSLVQIISVAMIVEYVTQTQLMEPRHIQKPRNINVNGTMKLDSSTIKNLELVSNAYSGDIKDSLISVIDKTETRMGSRLLYSWVLNPLISKKEILKRVEVVESFVDNKVELGKTRELLSEVSDIERIVGKIGLGRVNGRDFRALQVSIERILDIDKVLLEGKILNRDFLLQDQKEYLNEIVKKIDRSIVDEPPTSIMEGGIIKNGYNNEVDELRNISGNSKGWIKDFEKQEREKTGISSLKIGFNKVFGYYIEVTKTHMDKVPDSYIRKQTLVNCERYITDELKKKEDIILNAQEKLFLLEYEIFLDFKESFIPGLNILQKISRDIAELDILAGFAHLAISSNYVKPEIFDLGENNGLIDIKAGRHPGVEQIIEEDFISNDTYLDSKFTMSVLTGPNMSGKSTYIRQVALLVLLTQIGSFVPAKSATISIVDRIFTRVGASDDLSRGRSTFMVEMDEAANILNNATKFSLVILDEVGRGTSTYDGVSIAWAISEYLITNVKARTLFATHYHELLKLATTHNDSVRNYNVLVEEDLDEGTVIFLRRIVEGGTDRSYGIYVAKMAGLPESVVVRANEILEGFEQEKMFNGLDSVNRNDVKESKVNDRSSFLQYPLFTAKNSEVEKEIQDLDVDNMTPLEALSKINEWKKKV